MNVNKAIGRIKNLLKPGETLSQRVVHAGFWVFALSITARLFNFARIVVLARLLAPEDFGLFGIALVALSMLETFSQTGFRAALIQKAGDVRQYLDTAWTVQFIRGLALAVMLFAIAPYLGAFFGEPRAAWLVRTLALCTIFRGLVNCGVVYFHKELEFQKEFIYKFSGTLVDLGVAISAALIFRNAWALVVGLLAGECIRTVVSFIIHPYRPQLRLEGSKAKELYTFGRWIFGSDVLVFLALNGDSILVGKALGVVALGFYQVAFRLSNLIVSDLADASSQITFPTYSKLQTEASRLKEAFLRTFDAVSVIALPLSIGIVLLGPDFVRIFLGTKWVPIIPAMQILTIAGFLRSLVVIGHSLFRGVGLPKIDFWMNLSRIGVMAALIYPLTMLFGITGTALAVLLSIGAAVVIWWAVSSKLLGYSSLEFWARLSPTLMATGIMALFVLIATKLASPVNSVKWFGLILSGIAAYLTCQFLFWKLFHTGLFKTIRFLRVVAGSAKSIR